MEHSQAIQMKAAERYVLGELPAGAREQYEDHLFDCAECAEELKLAAAFTENARAELGALVEAERELAPTAATAVARKPAAGGGWFGAWLRPGIAVPVFAALLLLVAYQNIAVIPHLKGSAGRAVVPQALASFSLITADSRGGEPLTVRVAAGQPFSLYFDIPPDAHYSSYACELENAAGAAEIGLNISAEQAKNAVQLLIPSSTLGPGKHVLVVRGMSTPPNAGGPATEVARYPFSFEISK
ncbi:MAG: hypothetical protein WA192_02040 [Candidatus Acidiferrales bacterium]